MRQIPTNFNHIIQIPSRQFLQEFIRAAKRRTGQYQTILQSPPSDFIDQVQSQPSLRSRGDFLWDPSLLPSDRIVNLLLGKIQSPIQGCIRFVCAKPEGHHHLAVRCLSQRATVLFCNSYRVLAVLGKRRVVNKSVNLRTKVSLHLSGQRRLHLLNRPGTLVHKLLQRLNVSICKTIDHWLDGFTSPSIRRPGTYSSACSFRSLRPTYSITSAKEAPSLNRNPSIPGSFIPSLFTKTLLNVEIKLTYLYVYPSISMGTIWLGESHY